MVIGTMHYRLFVRMRQDIKHKIKKGMKGDKKMNYIIDFIKEEDAIGVVEIILILVVLISLVVIFKNQLVSLVQNILSKITSQSEGI